MRLGFNKNIFKGDTVKMYKKMSNPLDSHNFGIITSLYLNHSSGSVTFRLCLKSYNFKKWIIIKHGIKSVTHCNLLLTEKKIFS